MPTFMYQAMGADGKFAAGSLEATDRLAAALQLQQRGFLPFRVETPSSQVRLLQGLRLRPGRRVSSTQRIVLTRTLASLLSAGIPLDRALGLAAEMADSPYLRQLLGEVLQDIKQGISLSAALEKQRTVFSPLFAAMVRAGEASGNLGSIFTELADYQESTDEIRRELISSLIYPSLLLLVGGASVLLLLQLVVPKFAAVFEQAGASLPLPTQILLTASRLVEQTWWLWLIAVPFVIVALRLYSLRRPEARRRWDGFVLKIPRVGRVIQSILVVRFARSWGTLLRGGVPLIRSLEIARDVVGNLKIASAVDRAVHGIRQGQGITRPLAESQVLPSLSLHLIGVGEETGQLDSMLFHVAQVYERESRSAIRNLLALLEPMLILVMGLAVGAIVISIFLAIFSISDIPL